MSDCEVERLPGDVRVVSCDPPEVSDRLVRRIDELWRDELRDHPHRFDGSLLAFIDRKDDLLRGRFVPYRYFAAQRRDPAVAEELGLIPLAVSGLLVSQGQIAFGRRSARSTQYPSWLELVPSGGIGAEHQRADGTIDHYGQLVAELAEEIGIPASEVVRVETVALLRDNRDLVVDIASLLEVTAAGRAMARARDEYESLCWVDRDELPAFIARERHTLVPTSHALCEVFLQLARG